MSTPNTHQSTSKPSVVSELNSARSQFDLALRPQTLDEYVGQHNIKESLSIALRAAQGRGEPLEHGVALWTSRLGQDLACICDRQRDGRELKDHVGASN